MLQPPRAHVILALIARCWAGALWIVFVAFTSMTGLTAVLYAMSYLSTIKTMRSVGPFFVIFSSNYEPSSTDPLNFRPFEGFNGSWSEAPGRTSVGLSLVKGTLSGWYRLNCGSDPASGRSLKFVGCYITSSQNRTYDLRPEFAWERTTFFRIPLWVPVVTCAPYPTIRVARWAGGAHRRRLRRLRGLCAYCGYNLAGNISGCCPECGRDIMGQPDRRSKGTRQ
jgi:hypothetical protein